MLSVKRKASVISDGDLIFYHIGFFVEDGFLIVLDGKNYLLTDGRYIEHAKLYSNAECFLLSEFSLCEFLKRLGVQSVGLIYNYSSAKLYSELIDNGFSVYDCTTEFNVLSAVKTPNQIKKIKKACEITEKAFYNVLSFVKEGVTELDLACELEYNFKKLGGNVGFETIVAFGKNSSVPHYKTGNVKLKPNTPILMDFGSSYDGYLSDMTRTFYFGRASEEFLTVYESVKNAHLEAVNFIKAGVTAKEVDEVARKVLKTSGLDGYFVHSLGHGVGVKIHEFPTISNKSQTQLINGMVFTIEPGVYLQGNFGIRIEDTVTVENGKCVSLMKSDKNPIIING